jgi:MFS family permease
MMSLPKHDNDQGLYMTTHAASTGATEAAANPGVTAAALGAAWPSAKIAWYSMLVMILSLTFAQLDMQIVPYLAGYIKADLRLSDFDLSLLLGASFGLFYTIVGVPLAWFVDRYSRKWILAAGITTWSIGTAFCGVSQNFAQLFISRFLVGAGEAVNGPTSYSIVADLFPRERLPRAIAVLNLGSVVGPAIALFISAFLLIKFVGMPGIAVPFGVIHGWQLIFILVGLPGVLVALLMVYTLPEPVRRIMAHQTKARATQSANLFVALITDFGDAFAYIFAHWKVYLPMFLGLAVGALNFGAIQWMPIFYARTFGWEPAKVAMLNGTASIIMMPIALAIGVWMAERFQKAGRDDAALRVLVIARLIGLPLSIAAPLMPSPWLTFAFTAFSGATIGLGAPSQNAAFQTVTPNPLRGKMTALYLLIYSVVGFAIAPSVTAALTDFIFRDEAQIKWAIFSSTLVFAPASLFIIWLGVKPYGKEVARLKQLEAAAL